MSDGFALATARRMWFVVGLEVWGMANWGRIDYLVAEQVAGATSILYGDQGLGDDSQSVLFGDLTDHRGNKLPDTIEGVRVLVRARSADAVYIVGEESSTGFKVARDPAAEGPVSVDLLVVELSL